MSPRKTTTAAPPTCPRIGGCLLKADGAGRCCCQTGTCDGPATTPPEKADPLRIIREAPYAPGTRVGARQEWFRQSILAQLEGRPVPEFVEPEKADPLREALEVLREAHNALDAYAHDKHCDRHPPFDAWHQSFTDAAWEDVNVKQAFEAGLAAARASEAEKEREIADLRAALDEAWAALTNVWADGEPEFRRYYSEIPRVLKQAAAALATKEGT